MQPECHELKKKLDDHCCEALASCEVPEEGEGGKPTAVGGAVITGLIATYGPIAASATLQFLGQAFLPVLEKLVSSNAASIQGVLGTGGVGELQKLVGLLQSNSTPTPSK